MRHDALKFLTVVRYPAAAAAERKGRPNDRWKSDFDLFFYGLLKRMRDFRPGRFQAYFGHCSTKQIPVLSHVDSIA